MFSIFFFFMGYQFIDFNPSDDISRYYDAITSGNLLDLADSVDLFMFYIMIIFDYFRLKANYLGAISALLFYISSFYIIHLWNNLTSKTINYKYKLLLVVLLFFSTTMYSYTGMRFCLAINIELIALLLVLKNRKISAFWVAILGALIHFSVVPFVFIVLILNLKLELKKSFMLPLIAGTILVSSIIIAVLPMVISIPSIIQKIDLYTSTEVALWYGSIAWLIQKAYCVILLLPALLTMYRSQLEEALSECNISIAKFYNIIYLYYLLMSASASIPVLLSRMSTTGVYLSALILALLLLKSEKKSGLIANMVILILLGVIGLFISGNAEYRILLNNSLFFNPFI